MATHGRHAGSRPNEPAAVGQRLLIDFLTLLQATHPQPIPITYLMAPARSWRAFLSLLAFAAGRTGLGEPTLMGLRDAEKEAGEKLSIDPAIAPVFRLGSGAYGAIRGEAINESSAYPRVSSDLSILSFLIL